MAKNTPMYSVKRGGSSNDSQGGGNSMRYHNGDGAPSEDLGQPGDIYVDTTNGDMYSNENGKWNVDFNIKGEAGPAGASGTDGEKGPKGDTGSEGPQGEVGPEGPKGEAGPQGPAGKDGADAPE